MKNIIINDLKEFLTSINEDISLAEVLNVREISLGHYSTNLAMKLSKKKNISFDEIGKQIQSFFKKFDIYKTISLVNPGFINFYLKNNFIAKQITKFYKQNYYPSFEIKKLNINYEFISANPTGFLHIGHARNAIVGDINCRVMEYIGHKVTREYYINDAGNQINDLIKSVKFYYENPDGEASDDIPYKGREIKDASKLLKREKSNLDFQNIEDSLKIREWLLKHFLELIKQIIKKIKVKPFDIWSPESDLYISKNPKEDNFILSILNKLKKTNFVYEKDGAIWLETTKFGDENDRVLQKSDKSFTYVMGDIAYHVQKISQNYDILFDLWGTDHKGYEKRVFAGLEALGIDLSKLKIDFINMVQVLKNDELFKMSKRAGTSVTIKEIINDINVDILRFFMVSKNKEQSLEIDINLSQKKDMSNPYHYAQYALVRIFHILKKANKNIENLPNSFEFLGKEEKELELMLKMLEYNDVVLQSYKYREPHILIKYIQDLSNLFHSFYNSVVVISDDEELTKERLILLESLKNIYLKLFDLIGIQHLESM